MDIASRPTLVRSLSSTIHKKRSSILHGPQKQFQVVDYHEKIDLNEHFKVNLERVIGLTVVNNAQLAIDSITGTIAYSAGCVVVLLSRGLQDNIINTSRKSITAITFSSDGKFLAIGETGHSPAVRVYELSSKLQITELLGHKFGISHLAFSPNGKYLVSVGTQHDMVTNVWNWRQGLKVASNKISSKVNGLAFSSDGNMFVTIGVRHVKYWFLDESKRKTTIQNKNETIPLLGRNGLLGDQKTHVFVDVACGKGAMSDSVYVLAQNGILCLLTDRQISKTVELKTIRAYCLKTSETLIIVGCAGGVIRLFDAQTMQYIQTLPKPYPLGISVVTNQLAVDCESHRFPDTIGLVLNEQDMSLVVSYSDRSLYKWDLSRLPQVGRIFSFLFHSSCVWDVDVYPNNDIFPHGTFITSSSDDTIRLWNLKQESFFQLHQKKPTFNHELLNIIYTDPSLGSLCEQEYNTDKPDIYESRNGVRCVTTSPNGLHLASGDLVGNIRIHDLCTMTQVHFIEAHDAGVLCLEYSNFSNERRLLISASRDRLIHVFDAANDYTHLQSLSDHSSSIFSVKVLQNPDASMLMISCANDKSLLFRIASDETENTFTLNHNVLSKSTPHDMILDSRTHCVITACQDRMIRIYNSQTGKNKRNYKGSNGEDGFLQKLAMDRTGTLLAVSSSDKSIAILDYLSGDVLATLVGHSELITGLKFTFDCRHLISASADGCMFLWSMAGLLYEKMFSSSLKRTKNDVLSKPDVTLVNLQPHNSFHEDVDEKAYTISQQKQETSALPAWARDSPTINRGKWDKGRATPVMTSIKNGEVHMSPDSALLANGSANVIPIATQSQASMGDDEFYEDATDEDEERELFFEDGLHQQRKLNHQYINNNSENINYKILPHHEPVLYTAPSLNHLDHVGEFAITHRMYKRAEDEKSSTSEGTSLHTMESEDDGAQTPVSSVDQTPLSSMPSTPMSPNNQLMDAIHQIIVGDASYAVKDHVNNNHLASRPLDLPVCSSANPVLQLQDPPLAEEWKSQKNTTRKESLQKNLQKQEESPQRSGARKLPNQPTSHTHNLISHAANLNSVQFSAHGSQHESNDTVSSTEEHSEKDSEVSFTEIDQLCSSLKSNMAAAQKLYKQLQSQSNSEKDYLIETIRDVCDAFHTMLPPTSQFEAIAHQAIHQFLILNKDQHIMDKLNKDFKRNT